MPVLADSVPPSAHTSPGSSSSSSKFQGRYIFGSLALVIIFVLILQKRLEKRKKSEKYAQYSDHKSNKPSLSPHSRGFMNLSSRAARMSFPSALPEKQYPSASGSGSTTRPLQSNDYDPTSISSIMRPTSSSSQQHSSPTYELPLSLERETQQDLTPPHYSSSYPGLGADTAIPTFQEPGQGQGHEDHPFPSPSSQAKNPQLTPPPSKSRILRPPQKTPPPISAGTPKTMNLSANTNTNNISTPSTITATTTSTSRRSSSGSSLLHPDLPDPSIVSLNTTPSGASRVGGLTIFTNTNTNTEYGPQQGQGQVQLPGQGQFEPQYPITFVPSPTEYTSFEALYSQNPPYYEASSSSFPSETEAATEQIPRRRSYTKSLSNGSEVSGEIIVSSSGIEGQGWRRHTRVFGGGVCRACEESKGWERGELRRSSE